MNILSRSGKNIIGGIFLVIAFYLLFNHFIYFKSIKAANLTQNKPNIVIIIADDLGWRDVSFHDSEIKTPNLDRLAQTSVRLERFYVKSSCTPTRAALMTGRHPFRYGMSSSVVKPWEKVGLPLEEKTIAQTLKEAGYYTAITGKWHLGHYKKEYLPTYRGFDYHYGHYCGGVDYFSHELDSWIQGGLDWHRNEKPVEEEGYTTDLIGQEAVNLISSHNYNQSPLFLYVSFNAPHDPLQAKKEDIANQTLIQDEGRRIFAAQVHSMDEAIGKIIQSLKNKQQWDNTLIVFTSDNGGSTYGTTARGDNRPLRGQKGTLYEGGVRVPTIISYPATVKGGQINQQVFSIVDLYPTFAQVAGVNLKSQKKLDGINILEAITTGSLKQNELLIQYINPTTAAIIEGDYKLVNNGMAYFNLPYYGTVELFNLKNDPLETHDLAATQPDKVRELQDLLKLYAKDARPSVLSLSTEIPQDFVIPKVWNPESLQNNRIPKKLNRSFREQVKRISRLSIAMISFLVGFGVGSLLFFSYQFRRRTKEV